MKLSDITSYLDSIIPLRFQEAYDNSGLQVGVPDREINSAMVTLDVTEEVVNEAVKTGCDLIVSHHPIIFNAVKRISGDSITGRVIHGAIKNDVAIYSAHTNLDSAGNGVSRRIAGKMELDDVKVLAPLRGQLLKLVTFIPSGSFERVRDAIFDAGAGMTGNYDRCGFSSPGTGSFRGNENSNPLVGEKGKMHFENEIRFETLLFAHLRDRVINALVSNHPYEEPAYDLYSLENDNIDAGAGCTGMLARALDEKEFIEKLSSVFNTKGIRHSRFSGKKIRKIAVCGGAGSSLLHDAIASGADAFVTSDIKYHTFLETGDAILLVDAGHYESEIFSVEILRELLIKKFPNFAVRFSKVNTNPINYF
jgi:dinuclear metal center YbgI/SA1388 family protein